MVINYFSCCSFKACRKAKQIAPATKNKWHDGWLKYWFYHKVHLVEEKNQSDEMVKRYPLAEKMGKSAFECKPTFEDTRVSKTVEKAYKLGASLYCGRDLVEEYVAP